MSDNIGFHPLVNADQTIEFRMGGKSVLTIQHDGKLVRGPGFDSDDSASVAFMEALSTFGPGFISELRTRAERAESELAKLKEKLSYA